MLPQRNHERQNESCELKKNKQFEYPVSGKGFSSFQMKKAHEETHKESPQFTCEKCDKSFHSNKSVQDHKRRAHNEVSCQYCAKKLLQTNLKTHVKKNHLINKGGVIMYVENKSPPSNHQCHLCPKLLKLKVIISDT